MKQNDKPIIIERESQEIKELKHVVDLEGTWITVPTNTCSPNEWMNLHESNNYSHIFRIPFTAGISPIEFSFTRSNTPIDVLRKWLKDNNQELFYEPLHSIGVKSIKDLPKVDFKELI